MTTDKNKQLFVSYAQIDAEPVERIIDSLRQEFRSRAIPIDIWIDRDSLQPGERWDYSIQRALLDSLGVLIFVSPASMSSEWVRTELAVASSNTERFIVPIILQHVPDLPAALKQRQWIDLSNQLTQQTIHDASLKIADATALYLKKDRLIPPVLRADAPRLAKNFAREIRGKERTKIIPSSPPDSVFVVHGHDKVALKLVLTFLVELGIKPIMLSQIYGSNQSLLQKFFHSSREADFAIVILTADDLGASLIQYEADGVADKALQFRTRQNVILELGFFYGHLGWENVFVVYLKPPKVFPNFERPSDLDGAVFDEIDEAGQWRETLKDRLVEAGFKLEGS